MACYVGALVCEAVTLEREAFADEVMSKWIECDEPDLLSPYTTSALITAFTNPLYLSYLVSIF